MARLEFRSILIISTAVKLYMSSDPQSRKVETETHDKLSKFLASSSRRNSRSSTVSSSEYFLVNKFLTSDNNFATSIAGRFSVGAFVTKFCEQTKSYNKQSCPDMKDTTHPERGNNDANYFLFDSGLRNLDESGDYVVFPTVWCRHPRT